MAGIVALGIAIEARRNRKAAVAQQKRARTQRARDEAAAAAAFQLVDVHQRGALTREEARDLLRHVTGFTTIDEDGLDAVFVPAAAAARDASDAASGILIEPLATKEDLCRGVAMYRDFLSRYDEILTIMRAFDRHGNGSLDRRELRTVILNAEAKLRRQNLQLGYEPPEQDRREVWGFTQELMPTEAELDQIFQQCDVNADGRIGKAELLPALALWAQLAHQRIERQKNACYGSGCTVS